MNSLSVRELEEKDIQLIADYWVNYDPDHMIAMGVDLDRDSLKKNNTNKSSALAGKSS